jgi:nuclear pore complex protein Nup107
MPTTGGDAPRAPLAEHQTGVAPPDAPESLEHDDASLVRSEERAFARVVADVRAGAVAENETPAAFESVCRVRAAELRAAAASGDVARASTAHELLSEADDLDAEAATWSLAWFLLGEGAEAERESARAEKDARDAIARRQRAGGDPASQFADGPLNANPLPAPLSARVRMACRDEMNDPVTFRANRVVAWLEGNARAAMTREAMGVDVADALRSTTEVFRDASRRGTRLDAFDDFGKNECAWNETARALDASATSDGRGQALSLELDPDGPNRLNAALHPTNADAEARLCRAAFRLVRGGMMDAARELCVRAGQPWRAASLGGAAPGPGGFAPAPVGAAADAAFAASAAFPVAAAIASARRATMDAETANETNETLDEFKPDDAYDEIAFEAIASNADSPAADAEDEELAAECDDVSAGEKGGEAPKTGKESAKRRALWKWACAETARQILSAPTFAPSARHEAALYGACAGDIRATLPACEGDWEASAWAYFRALLDARVDAAVDGGGGGATAPGPGPALVDDDDPGSAAADDGAFETSPRWPTAASAAATPRTAEEILETLRPLAAREARGARARLAQRDAQRCLILGRTRELAAEAAPQWVFPEEAPERGDVGGHLRQGSLLASPPGSAALRGAHAPVPADGAPRGRRARALRRAALPPEQNREPVRRAPHRAAAVRFGASVRAAPARAGAGGDVL